MPVYRFPFGSFQLSRPFLGNARANTYFFCERPSPNEDVKRPSAYRPSLHQRPVQVSRWGQSGGPYDQGRADRTPMHRLVLAHGPKKHIVFNWLKGAETMALIFSGPPHETPPGSIKEPPSLSQSSSICPRGRLVRGLLRLKTSNKVPFNDLLD